MPCAGPYVPLYCYVDIPDHATNEERLLLLRGVAPKDLPMALIRDEDFADEIDDDDDADYLEEIYGRPVQDTLYEELRISASFIWSQTHLFGTSRMEVGRVREIKIWPPWEMSWSELPLRPGYVWLGTEN